MILPRFTTFVLPLMFTALDYHLFYRAKRGTFIVPSSKLFHVFQAFLFVLRHSSCLVSLSFSAFLKASELSFKGFSTFPKIILSRSDIERLEKQVFTPLCAQKWGVGGVKFYIKCLRFPRL